MFSLQFGLVHHFTKLGSGEYYLEELENEICRKRELRRERKDIRKSSATYSLTKTVSFCVNADMTNPRLDNNLYTVI